MKPAVDAYLHDNLNKYLSQLEKYLKSDVIFYSGDFLEGFVKYFRDFIEEVKADNKFNKLTIILRSMGGSATACEKMVYIVRHHYAEVQFIVPDYAYSAGTLFCMSGDEIYMDYSACLGPVDPQVELGKGQLVPALGYLDKVNEMIEKSRKGTLTDAEFALLQSQDFAKLRSYEQARDLSNALLQTWLVNYKFKNWNTHETDVVKKGQPVTLKEKKERAKKIAEDLSDNKKWHSHGRPINIEVLTKELRVKIKNLNDFQELKKKVRIYNDLICDYADKSGSPIYVHSRKFI